MIFISLIKLKQMPTKEELAKSDKLSEDLMTKKGIKRIAHYWTLGRFDSVFIFAAPTEKDAMELAIESAKRGLGTTETLVAILHFGDYKNYFTYNQVRLDENLI